MRIAICDDEPKENQNLTHLIYDYADENKLEVEVYSFTSGTELIKEDKFDLYFLDYIMPEMNGTQVALALKEKFNDSVTISFLTSYEKAAIELINENVNAIGFLTKPAKKEALFKIFEKLEKNLFFNNIVLKKDQTAYIFHPQDIIYVEAMRKKVIVHTFDESIEFRLSFADMEENYLPHKLFIKIHRSFIVNLTYIKTYNKKEVTMRGGEIIPIRRGLNIEAILDKFNIENFTQ